jgi:DNA-binding MarR family transcriptional regulator
MPNDTCHATLLRKAYRKASSRYDDLLAPLSINIGQFSLLRSIRRMAPVSLTDLGARVELDRSTVGRNSKVLERMGLIATVPGKDKREAMLTITEKGHDILSAGAPLWDQAQEEFETRLGPGNMKVLNDLLSSL